MTREEAIKILYKVKTSGEENHALVMAIKALEQEPTTKNDPRDDVVSRKEVLNQIFYSTDNSGDVVLGSALRERIARLPSVTPQEPKWISVSERLPEENGEYLITWSGVLKGFKKRSRLFISVAEFEIYEPENYADWITNENEFRGYNDIKVTAWMPLPKPYEPQESEDK